jgi:hypothetical protein
MSAPLTTERVPVPHTYAVVEMALHGTIPMWTGCLLIEAPSYADAVAVLRAHLTTVQAGGSLVTVQDYVWPGRAPFCTYTITGTPGDLTVSGRLEDREVLLLRATGPAPS